MIFSNAAPEGTGNFKARENVKTNFMNAGANKVDIVDLDASNLDSILNYDLIYVLGGNLTPLIELNKKQNGIDKETLKTIAILIAPFGPHIAEELYSMGLNEDEIHKYLKEEPKAIKVPRVFKTLVLSASLLCLVFAILVFVFCHYDDDYGGVSSATFILLIITMSVAVVAIALSIVDFIKTKFSLPVFIIAVIFEAGYFGSAIGGGITGIIFDYPKLIPISLVSLAGIGLALTALYLIVCLKSINQSKK